MQHSGHEGGSVRRAAVAAALTAVGALAPQLAQAQAQEPPPRYYGAAHIGQNQLSNWAATVDFGGTTVGGGVQLDRGLHFGLMLGRQTEKARFEVEYQRGRINVEGVTLGPVSRAASATGIYQALTVNGYRTFELNSQWNSFVGLGVGWGRVRMPGLGPVSGCSCFPGTTDDGLVWQARVGAEYELTPDSELFGQFTYLRFPSNSSGGVPSVHYAAKGVGALSLGYRKTF